LFVASPVERWILLCIVVGVLVGVSLTLFSWAVPPRGVLRVRHLRAEIVSLTLVLAVLALTYGRSNPWRLEYLFYIPMAGAVLLSAALVEQAIRYARVASVTGKVLAVLMVGMLVAPWAWQARYSPLIYHYGEGEAATAAARSFFEQARARIEAAPDGSIADGPLLPRRVPPRDPLRVLGTTVLLDYSVQAWADLTLPERRVRVIFHPGGPPPGLAVSPDEVVLLLTRPQPGF
jgi:hypothetical protein